jgi:putative methionine-R-sulfoxide reductase with GAF domain
MSQAFSHHPQSLRQPELSPHPSAERYEQERRDQFIRFTRGVQLVTLLPVVPEIIIGYTRHDNRWYLLALWAYILFLVTAIARRSALKGRLKAGVYTFISITYPILATLPLFVAGMLPVIALGNILAVILIALFVSPRLVLRATVIAVLVFSVATLLEQWSPFSTLDIPALGRGLTLIALLFVGGLAFLFSDSLSQAVSASQRDTGEWAHCQAELTARSEELKVAAADLAARTAEFEEASFKLKEASYQSQRRADLLQASIDVSHAVVQIQELDRLLSQVTRLISHHFGFYHTGVFLIDHPSGYAVLRSANSAGGQRMLARQHKLKVGSAGIVGYVTGTGQPRIALDVGEDALFFDNPDLPDTHSEMAVPLHTGDELIGALDVQSTAQNAFDEQDVSVLTALADQITIAIQNARLFQQNQLAIKEAEKAYRRYLRQEWDRFLGGRPSRSLASQRSSASVARTSDGT